MTERKLELRLLVSVGLTLLFFVCLAAFYHYLRFQNILEVGQRFQQGSERYSAVLKSGIILSTKYFWYKAGIHINVHCNVDEASEVFLDSVEAALEQAPRWDHRHTVQHSQMAHENQFRRMAILGMCANIFANHIYFWGDAHYTQTLGPERAKRMDACGTTKRCGVHFSIHSDNPVTPIGPLFTAWCAVNRMTASGRVLGEFERISVHDALYAVTLDAAYLLKMEREIGSIEVGKRADFCVLDEDPLTIPPEMLKDVPVWGTVLGGHIFQSPALK